jgi:hypothetical protein
MQEIKYKKENLPIGDIDDLLTHLTAGLMKAFIPKHGYRNSTL